MEGFLDKVHQVVSFRHLNVAESIVYVSLIFDFSGCRKLSLADDLTDCVDINREEVHGGPVLLFGHRLSDFLRALLGRGCVLCLHGNHS